MRDAARENEWVERDSQKHMYFICTSVGAHTFGLCFQINSALLFDRRDCKLCHYEQAMNVRKEKVAPAVIHLSFKYCDYQRLCSPLWFVDLKALHSYNHTPDKWN